VLAGDCGYGCIQQLRHRPVWAAVITPRSATCTGSGPAAQLCSWAGLTPRPRVRRHGSAAGMSPSKLEDAARGAHEAIQRVPATTVIGSGQGGPSLPAAGRSRTHRQGRRPARPGLLTLVYYGLRAGRSAACTQPRGRGDERFPGKRTGARSPLVCFRRPCAGAERPLDWHSLTAAPDGTRPHAGRPRAGPAKG